MKVVLAGGLAAMISAHIAESMGINGTEEDVLKGIIDQVLPKTGIVIACDRDQCNRSYVERLMGILSGCKDTDDHEEIADEDRDMKISYIGGDKNDPIISTDKHTYCPRGCQSALECAYLGNCRQCMAVELETLPPKYLRCVF